MATIFTKIINGEIPSYKIAENNKFYAFLDISPLSPGHTLVVPKREVDEFFDLSSQELKEINVFAQKIAKALKQEMECLRVGLIVFGLEVPHAHMHLIPIRDESDMSFAKEREELTEQEMMKIAATIRAALEDIN